MLVLSENNLNLPIAISIDNFIISSTETVELLAISIDKLSFSSHITSIFRKAGNTVRNLNRLRRVLTNKQLILLFKTQDQDIDIKISLANETLLRNSGFSRIPENPHSLHSI